MAWNEPYYQRQRHLEDIYDPEATECERCGDPAPPPWLPPLNDCNNCGKECCDECGTMCEGCGDWYCYDCLEKCGDDYHCRECEEKELT